MKYYPAIKKNEILHLWHYKTREYYIKWNKSDWERQILYDLDMWNLKNKTHEQI